MAPGTCGEFVRNRQRCLLTLRSHIAVIPRKTFAQCAEDTQPESRVAGAQRLLGTVGEGVGVGGGKELQTETCPGPLILTLHQKESSASHL